ncbi:MAG: YCF48-related protein [Caldimonas sp.]
MTQTSIDRVGSFSRRWGAAFAVCALLLMAACGGGEDARQVAAITAPAARTVQGPDGTSIVLPAGALGDAITVRIAKDSTNAPPLPPVFTAAGEVYDITPNGQALRLLATVSIPVDPEADDAVVLAEANTGGIWTLRSDAIRDGANLVISVSRLGQYRAVRFANDASSHAARFRALAQSPRSPGRIRLNAAGFTSQSWIAPFPYVLRNGAAFAAPSVVEVLAFSRLPILGDSGPDVCPIATSIETETYYKTTASTYRPFGGQTIAIDPAGGGPWAFDLRIYRPYAPDGLQDTFARVFFECIVSNYYYRIAASEDLSYLVPNADAVGILAPVADRAAPIGGTADFDVRVFGGPAAPTDRDAYQLFWERSADGTQWQQIGTATQLDAVAVSESDGRLHTTRLANLSSADNGAQIRARACYTPPGAVEQCATSGTGRLTEGQATVASSITRQPQSMSTLQGETANFVIAASGTPPPSIQWQLLAADGATWLDIGGAAAWPGTPGGGATLVTPPGGAADNGTLLRAVVTNAGGSATSDTVFWRVSQAPVAPTFTVQPAAASVPLGTNTLLAAAADGTAPLSYQWTRNDVPIAGATSPILRLTNVQAADFAAYRLSVSGPGGSVTSIAATLSESAGPGPALAPLITTQPAPVTVAAGAGATFRVAVSGSPAPACQWTRNGIAIVGAASCVSYTTQPATAGDNGAVFNVVVSTAGGTAIGGGAVLTVQGIAPATAWTFLPTGSGTTLSDITLVAGDPNRVVAIGYDGAIIRSTDGGTTWSRVYGTTASQRYLLQVRFADAQVGLAVGGRDILRSSDGGATWSPVWRAEDYAADYPQQQLAAVEWIDANTAIAIGVSRVWRSTDRGLTWSVYGSYDFSPAGVIHSVRFGNAQLGLAASNYRLFRTTDGGLTWDELPGAFSTFTDPLYGLGHGTTDQEWVAVGGSGIYRSTDGGVTWSRNAIAGYLLGLAAHGNDMTAVGENGLVLRSSDGGATWNPGPSVGFGQLWSVDFASGHTFVSGSGGLVARHD